MTGAHPGTVFLHLANLVELGPPSRFKGTMLGVAPKVKSALATPSGYSQLILELYMRHFGLCVTIPVSTRLAWRLMCST